MNVMRVSEYRFLSKGTCVLRIRKSSGDWCLEKSTAVILPSIVFKTDDVWGRIIGISYGAKTKTSRSVCVAKP